MDTKLTQSQQWMFTYANVVKDSWQDENIKTQLLKDPKKTLEIRYSYTLPEHINIEFKEVKNEEFKGYSSMNFNIEHELTSNSLTKVIEIPQAPVKLKDMVSELRETPLYGAKCICGCL